MKRLQLLLLTLAFWLTLTTAASTEELANKDECVAMCKAAAKMLLENKEAGIKEIANPKGKFVWKDSYVYLMDMKGRMLAHPFIPELTKKANLLKETDQNRRNPKRIFAEFVDVAKNNGEGWVDYKWPKPGQKIPTNKFTFIYRVGYTDMLVGAGIYKK
jgi:signal transduction histidine kinase